MLKLVLGSLIAVAAVGCTTTPLSHVDVTWQFVDAATNTTTGCPAGYDTAALYTQAANPDGTPVGGSLCTAASSTCYIDLFNCSDGQGISSGVPADYYISWVEITDSSGANLYANGVDATSPDGDSTFLDLNGGDDGYDVTIANDGGNFRFAWDLVGASSNAPLTCADAGVTAPPDGGVELISTVTGGTAATDDKFNCDDGLGTTAEIPAGSYTVSVDAFTSAGAVGTASTLTNQTIVAPPDPNGTITDLGTIQIPITGM